MISFPALLPPVILKYTCPPHHERNLHGQTHRSAHPPPEINGPQSPKKGTLSPKQKKLIAGTVAAIAIFILIVALLPCSHEWKEATCTQPKTCTKCEATEGDSLGHDWKEATCTQPKTCDRCKATEGKPLGHEVAEWTTDKEPSCTETGSKHGICIRCKETIESGIPKTEHIEGEWATVKEPVVNRDGSVTPGEKSLACATCGEVLSREPIKLELSTSQKNAMRTAQRYLDTMGFSYSGLIDQLEYEKYSLEDATFAADHCGADWNEQAARVAQRYIDVMSFSRGGLIDQLEYEGFNQEQATYGADAVGL